jgi:hypothetical protein
VEAIILVREKMGVPVIIATSSVMTTMIDCNNSNVNDVDNDDDDDVDDDDEWNSGWEDDTSSDDDV